MEKTTLEQFALDHLPQVQEYLTLPSVSAQNQGITETCAWLQQQFTDLGAQRVEQWTDQGGNPVLFVEFQGQSDRTVLFYNHYDVQPPEPLDEWKTPAFEPIIQDGRLIARGACDDKGELMCRLTVIKYFQDHGGLPCNLKFIIEGEEEIGSPHIAQYVTAHAADLKADVCIWEGGGKDENENFQIVCGAKGAVSFDLHVKTAAADLHSSLAVYADNAAWRLVQALASLKTPDNHIAVAGFYDDIRPLTAAEQAATQAMDFDEDKVRRNYDLQQPLITKDPKTELVNGTTLTINGLTAGYTGPGSKTIIPKEAHAKLDCRLVPNQDPHKIVHLIQQQLEHNGFGDVQVEYRLGEAAGRSNLEDPFIQMTKTIADQVYGAEQVKLIPNMPGAGPIKPFLDQLHTPIVLVGVRYAGSHPHSPNENIRLQDYQTGTYYLARVLATYGASHH